jgi:putative membrane protein
MAYCFTTYRQKPTVMKNNVMIILFLASIMVMVSCGKKAETDSKEIAEDQNEQKFDSTSVEDDTEFAVDIADASLLEVRLGELAQTNGASAKVKDLGKMMVTDHTAANEELKSLATQKNISLPGTLSEKSQKEYDDLAQKRGEDFDKAYADAMVDGHKKVISKFQKESEDGKDPELKSWASAKLPTLQHHLTASEETKEAVKGKN